MADEKKVEYLDTETQEVVQKEEVRSADGKLLHFDIVFATGRRRSIDNWPEARFKLIEVKEEPTAPAPATA